MQKDVEIGQYTIIDQPCEFGREVWIGNFVHIRPDVKIGHWSQIRDYCFIAEGVRIGNNTRVYQYCNVGAWTEIGNDCFIGVGTVFANDKVLAWPDQSRFMAEPPLVGDNVRIGMKCVILPRVKLSEGCVIGAGSVVTKTTKPWTLYVGNPAREVREISRNSL